MALASTQMSSGAGGAGVVGAGVGGGGGGGVGGVGGVGVVRDFVTVMVTKTWAVAYVVLPKTRLPTAGALEMRRGFAPSVCRERTHMRE